MQKTLGENIVEQTQRAVIECEQRISGEQRARESLEQSATQSVEKETARLEKLLDDKLASSGRKFQSAMAKWCKVSGAKMMQNKMIKLVSQPLNKSVGQSVSQPVKLSISQRTNQPASLSVNQPASQSLGLLTCCERSVCSPVVNAQYADCCERSVR